MLLKGSFAVRIRLYLAPVLRSCSASGAIRFLKWSTTVSAFFAPSLAESSSLIGDIGSGVGEEEDTWIFYHRPLLTIPSYVVTTTSWKLVNNNLSYPLCLCQLKVFFRKMRLVNVLGKCSRGRSELERMVVADGEDNDSINFVSLTWSPIGFDS